MNLPTLNMIGWSIDDYEVAFDAIELMTASGNGVMCQPRAGNDLAYFPGAQFIGMLVQHMDYQQADMIGSLKVARFDDPDEELRRLKLILRYELDELTLAQLSKWQSAA